MDQNQNLIRTLEKKKNIKIKCFFMLFVFFSFFLTKGIVNSVLSEYFRWIDRILIVSIVINKIIYIIVVLVFKYTETHIFLTGLNELDTLSRLFLYSYCGSLGYALTI